MIAATDCTARGGNFLPFMSFMFLLSKIGLPSPPVNLVNPVQKILGLPVLVEIQIQCPHCGEIITSMADTSQGDYSTIEDCEVCCAPMNIEVICEPGQVEEVRVSLA